MTSTLDLSRYEPDPQHVGGRTHRLRQPSQPHAPDCAIALNGRHTCSCQLAPQPGKAAEPNATEREAAAVLARLRDLGNVQHQGLLVRFANGHKYTPDLWYPAANVAAECKGTYSHGSRQRSRLAFDQARIERPGITWLWMEQRKASKGKAAHWRIEHYGAQLTQKGDGHGHHIRD